MEGAGVFLHGKPLEKLASFGPVYIPESLQKGDLEDDPPRMVQ